MGQAILVHGEGPVSAVAYADTAAHTVFAVYHRFGIAVHLQFSAHGTATHADVLQGAPESGLFMAFEVRERDDDIGVS